MKAYIHLERGNPKAARVIIEHEGKPIDFTPYILQDGLRLDGNRIDSMPILHLSLLPEEVRITGDMQLVIQRAEREREADDAES